MALRHPLGHLCPLLEQGDDFVALVRRDVERGEVHPVLLRRDDARLAFTAEWNRLVQPAEGGAGRGRPASEGTRARRADDRGGHPRGTEQLAPGHTRGVADPVLPQGFPGYLGAMTPCTWLTSLDSASMARDSSWRCGSVTLS